MARNIEHSATYPADAKTVHDTAIDRTYLEAKLHRFGGTKAEITELSTDGPVTTVRTNHGVPPEKLPGPVRALLGANLTIVRYEQWRVEDDGYSYEVSVTMPNAPGSLTGTSQLRGADGSSTQEMTGQIQVNVPVVGGKIEEAVTGHILGFLDKEADFLSNWLREH